MFWASVATESLVHMITFGYSSLGGKNDVMGKLCSLKSGALASLVELDKLSGRAVIDFYESNEPALVIIDFA